MAVPKGEPLSQLKCKHCGHKLQSRGKYKTNPYLTRTWCKHCDRWDYAPSRHSRPARILLLDIETLPGEYYSFDPRVDYLRPEQQIKDISIGCWAAKWLFDSEIMGEVVSPEDAVLREDGSILKSIWKLVDDAQIVITQNGVRFDMKKLNAKWIEHGYKPPSHYKNVDTLLQARNQFGFTYNRLEELGKKFGIGVKHEMHFADWTNCLVGDKKDRKKALNKYFEYCKNDVAPLLEDVYLHMLPWMKNHPNMNIYTDYKDEVCTNCGSEIAWSEEYTTPQGMWEGFRCLSCGATGRGSGKLHKIRSVKIR